MASRFMWLGLSVTSLFGFPCANFRVSAWRTIFSGIDVHVYNRKWYVLFFVIYDLEVLHFL